jgi:SAM-dependent methyltransferase
MRADYLANYDQIARDWAAHQLATGENPWQPREHVEAMYAATLALLERFTAPGSAILDAGCAMGELMGRIMDRKVSGIDLSAEFVGICQGHGLDVVRGELEAMPYPDATFDGIIATDILEHVLDVNAVVREMLRVLRPGGVIVARSPNDEDLAPYLAPDFPYRFVHLRRWDEPSFRLLFDRIFGCEVVHVSIVTTAAEPKGEVLVVARKP